MKPQRFENGQAVTPNTKSWVFYGGERSNTPEYGEIYTISRYDNFTMGHWWVFIEEVSKSHSFREDKFDPVITTSELTEALEEIEATIQSQKQTKWTSITSRIYHTMSV